MYIYIYMCVCAHHITCKEIRMRLVDLGYLLPWWFHPHWRTCGNMEASGDHAVGSRCTRQWTAVCNFSRPKKPLHPRAMVDLP